MEKWLLNTPENEEIVQGPTDENDIFIINPNQIGQSGN